MENETLSDAVVEALRTVYDPEIPLNIYELGLVYGVEIDDGGRVSIRMTLTSPNCPEAQVLPARVKQAVLDVEGVTGADVEIVWDPPWSTERMSEAAKLQLGLL